jgi:hypothetical protein
MMLAPLFALLMIGVGLDSDPAGLVSRLGSARYAEREDATKSLERLGRDALPALRAARDSKDPEVRTRAATLVEKIESDLMIRPAMVRLDFQNKPVIDVVKQIAERSGIALSLIPENSPMGARRITLQAASPVPFWTALDRLCREGRLQHNIALQALAAGTRGTMVQLQAGDGSLSPYVSDSGPFRATLQGIHHHRDLALNQPGMMQDLVFRGGRVPPAPLPDRVVGPDGRTAPAVVDTFYFEFQIMAEPRMVLSQNGPLSLTEAIDDRGQSLLPAAAGAAIPRQSGYYGFNVGSTTIQLRSDLKHPDQPGRVIKHIRGKVPVVVSARKDDPLTINLADAKGKTFRNSEVSLIVHDVRAEPNNQGTSIDLSIRTNAASADASGAGGRFDAETAAFRSPNMPQNQIEILDARGRAYQHWFPSSSRIEAEEARMTLLLRPTENLGAPAQIRFYDMVRAYSEAKFDFVDVPMP